MPKILKRLLERGEGVTSVEYALIASLIAVVIIVAVNALGSSVQSLYEDVSAALGN